MSPANLDVIHAYRHLYRGLLRAVMHARPARYVARDQLRAAFRERGAELQPEAVKRTLWFFDAAARERGLEHRIVKNLLTVRSRSLRKHVSFSTKYADQTQGNRRKLPFDEHKKTALDHYKMTVAMLNQTMGLCLR